MATEHLRLVAFERRWHPRLGACESVTQRSSIFLGYQNGKRNSSQVEIEKGSTVRALWSVGGWKDLPAGRARYESKAKPQRLLRGAAFLRIAKACGAGGRVGRR